MGQPLNAGCNSIYTCMDKLSKFVKIIPCMIGDGGLLSLATAKKKLTMFFGVIECFRWYFMI